MNKSQRNTYKKLNQSEIGIRKITKIPSADIKCPNYKNELPIINKSPTYKIHDRNIEDASFPNPFAIPAHKRIFVKSNIKRKVKPIPFIMSEPKTICDIDGNFYKEIEGRPIRRFDDIKVYIRNLRDIALNKAFAAYLNDGILLINSHNEYELREYNKIVSIYAKTKSNFLRFVQHSFNIAKEIESTAGLIAVEIAKISDELDGYCFEYNKLKNQVFNIMYTFEVLMTYGKFLHSISPNSWRIEFDNLNSKIDFDDTMCVKQDSQLVLMSMGSSNELKVKAAKYSMMPSRIYFSEPKQLINHFETISHQCRNYMSINMISSKLVKACIKSRDNLKQAVDAMQDDIYSIKANVVYMERRELEYQSAFKKLLHGSFYQLFAGSENVKLFNCIQYVISRIFGDFDDPKDTVSSLMQRIEQEYLDLCLALDYLNLSTVTKATQQMFAHDIVVMKRAQCAQRALKECDILRKCLVASFEPARPRNLIRAKKSKGKCSSSSK